MIENIKYFIKYIVQGFLENVAMYAFVIMILLTFGGVFYSEAVKRIESPTNGFRTISIEHNSHKYIIFYRGRENGAVHDPDCWCKN